MSLWFLALKARKAGNWPRTFYTGLTVYVRNLASNIGIYVISQSFRVSGCSFHIFIEIFAII